jgi:hypothetical protein
MRVENVMFKWLSLATVTDRFPKGQAAVTRGGANPT